MSDVFISYARSAASEAHAVAEALRALGYSVWRDDDLPPHKPYAEVIGERLAAAKAVVVIWTAAAVKSQWVFSEANRAREDGKLVQLSLETMRLPMPFDAIQCADLAGWSGDLQAHGWRKVVDSIGDLVSGSQSAPASATAPSRKRSICVLPFANMSGDPEQAYFSDGISEDVITDLSKVSALFVVARNTAFTFKGKSVDVAEVAARLNVSHVLEGSVRKAGNRVRITAQLIDGATGGHVWAERYDRELDDIFALQDEISSAIVMALKLKMLPQEKEAIERRGTDSAEAYDLYLMARSYHLTGSNGDPRTYEAMVRLCSRAVEIDPDYAQAWALMATGQFNLRRVREERPDDESDAALERALALNPDLAEARALKARILSSAGRQEEATAEIAIALRLDPESYEVNIFAANISYTQGRLAEATPFYEKVITLIETDLSAPHMLISRYTALGDEQNIQRVAGIALERAEKALVQDRSNSNAMETGVTALAAQGERVRSQDWMRRALLVDPDNLQMRYNFACALAIYLGDVGAALDMLRPALERDNAGVFVRNARADPDFASLQGNLHFEAMLAAAEARLASARSAKEAERSA